MYTASMSIEVHVTKLSASTCTDHKGAVDAELTVHLDGGTLTGLEVTLVPDHRGELTAWGDIEHWCNDAALRAIRSYGESFDEDGDQRDERDLQDALIAAVQEAA